MGLFDSYFDPQGGGNLIDRLLAQLQQPQSSFSGLPSDQAQYGQQPMNAMAQAPIAQAPVMPQQNPQPSPLAQIPQMQQPMQAPMQQQPMAPAAQPAFLQPQNSPGGFGGAFRGAMANMPNGPLGMLMGGVAGAMGMGRGSPEEQQRRALQQNYQALLDAGVPEPKARLAAINPEYGKKIADTAFGSDKFKMVQSGQDGLGRQQFDVFNTSTGEYTPVKPREGDSSTSGGLGNMDLSGKEYLASIPVAQRGTVQGMVEGTIAPPSSFALSKPYWQNMIAAAKNYDPSFDATNWSGRLAGVKDFSAGKSSEMVRSANQTLHHTGALLDSMDALNNGDYPLLNRVGNAANEATGGGAPTAFRLNAHAVAEEMSKVFKGANLSDTEIKSWEQNLSENMSPEQQRAAVGKLKDLLQGSLQALDEKRVASMGQVAADKAGPIIKPEGQRVLQRIDEWLSKGSGKSSAAPGPLSAGQSTTVGNVTIRRVN